MTILLQIIAALIFVTGNDTPQEAVFLEKLDAYLTTLATDENFGLSIVIAKEGENVLQKSYGFANREHRVPNRLDTKFNIASIGKLFTAVAILQLREQGKIDLNQTLGSYLPDFPNQFMRDSITIQQLLTHTSGLPLWFHDDFDREPKFEYVVLSDYLPLYEEISIDKNKIGKHSYSNVGFISLGFVIEAVSKLAYRDYLIKHIFEPLAMKETDLWRLTEVIPNAAVGYVRPSSQDDWWKTNYHLNKGSSPAGGAYSSPRDLAAFYHGLMKSKILSRESWELMIRPQTETAYGEYGYGIGISKNHDHTIIGHLGGYYGIRGELMWYKDSNYVVAILANSDQTDYVDVSYFIKTHLTGSEDEKKAHSRTLALIDLIDFDTEKTTEEFETWRDAGNFDEALIQIKGYYHFNNQHYDKAKRLFALNYQLFPDSESAKRDVGMIKD